MKQKRIYLGLTLIFLTRLAFAASEYERQLTEATAQRDKAVADVIEPINRRYQTTLEQLLRKATASNDLEAAVKIKAALASVDPNALIERLRGRWSNEDKATRLQFTPGGNFEETWNHAVTEGRWQATSGSEVKVTLKKGDVQNYHISDDGTSIKRQQDGITWKREK